jgi:hypothetical protein
MKHGDISNYAAPIVAFNIDNLLFKQEEKETGIAKVWDKVVSFGGGKDYVYFNREIDKKFIFTCNNIWNNYNFAIYLVTFMQNDSSIEKLNDMLITDIDLYYTHLESFKDVNDLRTEIDYRYHIYFDNDTALLAKLGTKRAVSYSELPNYIRNIRRMD